MKLRIIVWLASATATVVAAQTPTPGAAATELRPYQASYELVARGMSAGTSSFALRKDGADSWIFESRNQPRGLFRLFAAASLTLTSHMRVGPDGVQPLLFTAAQPDGSGQEAQVHFDWEKNRATGVQEDMQIDMPLKAGVQDDLSVQIALMHALLSGQVPSGIALFDKQGIRDYGYALVGEETLHTAVGEVATVIYESHKANSPRRTRFWCAPQYGYVPVRAEQKREAQVQWTMELRSIHRD